jgi:DNA-binding transcriptional ArsR family regulator
MTKEDLAKIRSELESMNGKLERMMVSGGPRSMNCGPSGLVEHLNDAIDIELERRMVSPCDCRPSCKALFTDVLQRSSRMVGELVVEEQRITALRMELEQARVKAPYKKCSLCFEEVNNIFNGHVRMVRSQNSFVTEQNLRALILKMNEESVTRNLLDPISNPQRLEIMKCMAEEPRNYSSLSSTTGLKGGNLLFHLRKLSTSGMIVQDMERGYYQLTEKGSKVLRYLVMMTLELGEEKWV